MTTETTGKGGIIYKPMNPNEPQAEFSKHAQQIKEIAESLEALARKLSLAPHLKMESDDCRVWAAKLRVIVP